MVDSLQSRVNITRSIAMPRQKTCIIGIDLTELPPTYRWENWCEQDILYISNMGVFPLPRRVRSYMGPHMTCLQTAETYVKRYSPRAKDTNFDLFLHRSLFFGHLQFMIYFSLGLFTMMAFVMSVFIFILSYTFTHVFLRFQYKLTILLILLGRQRIGFDDLNTLCIYSLHVIMLFIGGFGWIFILFIETWPIIMIINQDILCTLRFENWDNCNLLVPRSVGFIVVN